MHFELQKLQMNSLVCSTIQSLFPVSSLLYLTTVKKKKKNQKSPQNSSEKSKFPHKLNNRVSSLLWDSVQSICDNLQLLFFSHSSDCICTSDTSKCHYRVKQELQHPCEMHIWKRKSNRKLLPKRDNKETARWIRLDKNHQHTHTHTHTPDMLSNCSPVDCWLGPREHEMTGYNQIGVHH